MRELTPGTYLIIGRQKQAEAEAWLKRHGVDFRDCYRYTEVEPGRFAIYTYERDADGRLAFLDGEPVRRQVLVDECPPPFYPEDAA